MKTQENKAMFEAREYLKCKLSALYFIENYIHIPVAGGSMVMKESDLWNNTRKYKDFVRLATSDEVDNIEILFSRQHGKTTTIAMIILWMMIFNARLKVQFLTLSKENAFDVIERMKFMLDHLPNFIKVKYVGKGDKKTYLELSNGSVIKTKYVSGNINPDRIGRGFSVPVVWIDEASFIPHMGTVWGAMQPGISAARTQAKKNKFPTKIFLSTTPNGAGTNWFYKMWTNGWDYPDIFDFEKNKPVPNTNELLNSVDNKNNFVKVKIHWSETGKDEKWFKQQVKELNFDMRRVNQEINLVFLGSSNTVFDDEIIAAWEPKDAVTELNLAYGETFKLFEEINPDDYYLLGVDSAASNAAKSDYCAIILTHGESGRQVGEWHGKFSVLKRFANLVKSTIMQFQTLFSLKPKNLNVIIERNSIGLGVIEEILYDDTFEYSEYLYYDTVRKTEKVPGLNTNASSREQMFNLLLSIINENPMSAQGILLQDELRNLEQKASGRYEAVRGMHDDLVMAYNFTLLVRHRLILSGFITTEETPSGLKMSQSDVLSYMNITFQTSNPGLNLTEKKSSRPEDFEIIKSELDTETENKIRKEIIKESGIPGMEYQSIDPDEDDFMDYLII